MVFNFNNIFGEQYEVDFEVYIEDKVVQKQKLQASDMMLVSNFMQVANQIRNDRRPMKIKMIRPDIIWDKFEQKQKPFNYEIECCNEAMTIWLENKQNGG